MRKYLFILAAAVFIFSLSGQGAMADWAPGEDCKMHFPQLPDETGWDVNATGFLDPSLTSLVLADDFMCMETGWITDIHFWGSWLGGIPGTILSFTLSIHEDIPEDPQGGIPYSRPGPTLWERTIPADDPSVAIVYIPPKVPPVFEGWYDPLTEQFIHPDHSDYYQYNVLLEEKDWSWQEEGKIYWLNISAIVAEAVEPPQPLWGWKSSLDHWNDDAVWALWGDLNWIDMYDPVIEEPPQSLDLAFVITGHAEDLGDAPDPTYPTYLTSNGARHIITGGLYLGACVDAEQDGQPDSNATGDDLAGIDDEDGVAFTSKLIQGKQANVTVTASLAGLLDAWVDFNDDGDWADAGEQIFASHPLSAGTNALSFNVPASAKPTTKTFARFRFSSAGALNYDGLALDGEVEDYEVKIRPASLPFLLLLLLD